MRTALAIAGLVVLGAIAIAVAQSRGGDSPGDVDSSVAQGEDAPDKGATGASITCPGGEVVNSAFVQSEDKFSITGLLSDVNGGHFTVDGPTGPMEMVLAFDSHVEGAYALGDAMHVKGSFTDDGRVEAEQVVPACASFVGAVSSDDRDEANSAAETGVNAVEVTPAPTEAPTAPVEPATQPVLPLETVDVDDDDNDNDARGNDGNRGNSGQGGDPERGNGGNGNGNSDEDDEADDD